MAALTAQQALEYINSFDDPYLAAIRNHGKQTWGLERIRSLLAKLGDPHRRYPTLHVAGTKGKGSTAAFIAQGLQESGLKTGLYLSPHLQDWRERIQINRALIAEEALAQLAADIQPLTRPQEGLSTFELTTALALWHFAREGCDVAVIEVGLGGRLDATSVIEPAVCAITNISLDHTQLLGDTLAEIAAEKAAIIKPGTPVVSAPQAAEARAVIEAQAAAAGSRLVLIGRDWGSRPEALSWEGTRARIGPAGAEREVMLSLAGAFQVENAAVALAVLEEAHRAGIPVKREAAWRSLAHVRWPGRLEIAGRDPLIILDSAHNPHSIEQLVTALTALGGYTWLGFVFGCMADKHAGDMLEALLPAADRVIFTRIDHARAALPADLLRTAEQIAGDARTHGQEWAERAALSVEDEAAAAISRAAADAPPGGAVCITGSLALAGLARSLLGLPANE